MTSSTTFACPRCKTQLQAGTNFCANCGADISGVWGPGGENMGKTIAVEVDPNVDTLAQLLSQATLGDYDIYGELGRGGMAAVYLGLDLALNRKVAIKTMLPDLVARGDMVERFKREAQTSAGLSHPHIIQIFSVKQTKQLVYFVMKFIEGRSLESVILDKGKLDVHMAQIILSQVASALAYAHRKHIIHRDVKPANVMIDEDGWAIVTDFGIAKVQEAQNLTATGTAIGTPAYMSPEQFHNKAVTGASDQYSLGIVAYEMLTGAKPFDGATYAEIITQHLFNPVPDLRAIRPDVPEQMVKTINRMLAKDPAERFPDLDAAAAEFGVPQKKEGDVVRTQMISLAKNGPQKKVRMSVPMSPIPAKPDAATVMAGAAATVVERAPGARPAARPGKRPEPTVVEKPKSMGRLVALGAGIAAVVLGIGFAGMKMMNRGAPPANQTAAVQPAGQEAAAATSPATANGQAAAPTNTGAPPDVAEPTAHVTVTKLPAGAVISLNGKRVTRDFTTRPGRYDLRVDAPGFQPFTRQLALKAGETLEFPYEGRERVAAATVGGGAVVSRLEARREARQEQRQEATSQGLAILRLILAPPATVFIDGANKGQQARIPNEELIPGTHTLRVERDGWVTKDTVVTINAGQTVTLRIQLTEKKP